MFVMHSLIDDRSTPVVSLAVIALIAGTALASAAELQ
jgi:hypothetical protein